jgi:hypothetical protein
MLVVGVTSAREREERLISLLCGRGRAKGYRAGVLTKSWLGDGASAFLLLSSICPSALCLWCPSSSFYRSRRGSTIDVFLEKKSPGDGKIECSTLVKSRASMSIWAAWSSHILYGGWRGQRGTHAPLFKLR